MRIERLGNLSEVTEVSNTIILSLDSLIESQL